MLKRGPYKKRPIEERFWEKVDIRGPNECWPWTAGTYDNGYGAFGVGGRTSGAHRTAFELTNDRKLKAGEVVRHSCDNRPCVNPAHLLAGTYADNSQDMIDRGRSPRMCGERNGRSKLTDQDVKYIRKSTLTQRALADIFGVHNSVICLAKSRKKWRHVE